VWGSLTLRRATRALGFTPDDVTFAASISPLVALGLSRAIVPPPPGPPPADAPGVVLLDAAGAIAGATEMARHWLQRLDDPRPPNRPPLAVASVALHARARDRDWSADRPMVPSRLRVRARSGEWLVLDGAACRDPAVPEGWVAVMVRPASPGDILSLAARRYDLSPREQAVVRHVLQGLSTRQIGATLGISPLTVQDHLKAIFRKTDVSSRRELAFRLALPSA
jgi:DNA-binding CsgD family transcriptional regulator